MLHDEVIVNGMLIVIAVITLTFAYRNLRHYLRRSPRPAPPPPPPAPAPAPARPRRVAAASGPDGPDPRWTAFEEAWADDGRG
jgi:hypothetical protein